MFAVIKTGGKQYKVAAEDVIKVDKVAGAAGDMVQFGEVLALGGDTPKLGGPTVSGASVAGVILEQGRLPTVIAFKKRRRKNSRRRRGVRKEYSMVRITEILTDGQQPSAAAPAQRRAKKPAAAPAEGATEAAPKKPRARKPKSEAE